jgi:hypothetical protein
MKKITARTKKFIVDHERQILITTIVVTLTSIASVVLQRQGIKSLNGFLVEKDLYDEYYLPED